MHISPLPIVIMVAEQQKWRDGVFEGPFFLCIISHLRLIITTSGGRRMQYTVMALKDCHRREVNLRIRPNLCSWGIHGVCGYIRVDTKTQQKEWHPSTSVLCYTSNKAIEIDFGFSVNDGDGKQVAYQRTPSPRTFSTNMEDDDGLNSWGFHNFALRSDRMSPLVNGTLVFEVHMKLAMPTNLFLHPSSRKIHLRAR
jgi:hypothetical protein